MIILASSSRYRSELLARLGKPFKKISPDVDETALPDERPKPLAARLALLKARTVCDQLSRLNEASVHEHGVIIGSDQTATLDGHSIIGKPGSHEKAVKQLQAASGRSMQFFTAVAMLDTKSGDVKEGIVTTTVTFRTLSHAQIETYLRKEPPYDCAGSAKSEGLGIALIAKTSSEDPTALIGLPLMTVCKMLTDCGHDVLAP